MAAPQIPNLNTLRRGQGRSLGRGRGASSSSLSDEEEKAAKDQIVQQTDQDASVSRLSAVELGYLDDPFAKRFVSGPSQRRFPIINRGLLLYMISKSLRKSKLIARIRNLRPHQSNRQPCPPLPLLLLLLLLFSQETNHLPRRRLRHSFFPPPNPLSPSPTLPLP
ncbi:MAG: hypothetical protein Q9199_006894 [Rusavskia elegans]